MVIAFSRLPQMMLASLQWRSLRWSRELWTVWGGNANKLKSTNDQVSRSRSLSAQIHHGYTHVFIAHSIRYRGNPIMLFVDSWCWRQTEGRTHTDRIYANRHKEILGKVAGDHLWGTIRLTSDLDYSVHYVKVAKAPSLIIFRCTTSKIAINRPLVGNMMIHVRSSSIHSHIWIHRKILLRFYCGAVRIIGISVDEDIILEANPRNSDQYVWIRCLLRLLDVTSLNSQVSSNSRLWEWNQSLDLYSGGSYQS